MPIYQTKYEGQSVGIYSAQRPSVAACKTFSTLRRRNPSMSEANIAVVTEGHRKIEHNYNVTYKNATDPFLGNITRPVAEEIKAKIDAKIDAELEAKIDAKIDAELEAKIEADLADIKSIKICIAPEQKMM